MNTAEILSVLSSDPKEYWITIPEGFRREQIAFRLVESLDLEDEEVFLKEFLEKSESFEGRLFPDTYLFGKDASVDKIISTMNINFENKIAQVFPENLSKADIDRIVVMASLIERETITSSERPLVSGILWKRLKNDWPLQVDATVQYILGSQRCGLASDCRWWTPPSKNDLNMDSPYNTYKMLGLPPGPICNPGLDSLNAAANPKSSEFWYYIHDREGNIRFAETLDEHNANVSKYLR